MAVREGNHLRGWLVFFLYGVEETARASADVFRAILVLKQRIEADVLPQFTARRLVTVRVLISHLYGQPVIDVKKAAQVTGATVTSVSALISDWRW